MDAAFLLKLQSAGRLNDGDRERLSKLCDDIRPFHARRDIIREGDRPDHVHLMIEGWSCRYKMLADGTRQITAFLVPGDFCDTQITIFDEMDHSIGSLTDCRVAFVPRALIAELTEQPAIARALWWASLVDEAVLRAWIVNMGRREAQDRIAHLICELHVRLRNVGLAPGNSFELPLTQEELSDALGLTSVHVNRTLKRLREDGLMTFRRQQIVITDVPALRKIADFDPNYLHLPAGVGED
jgi:CRP-like cAMP-binding protein